MKKKIIYIWFVLLMSIVTTAIPVTAQNYNEKRETNSLPEKLPQNGTYNPQFLLEPTGSFSVLSTDLFSPDLLLSPYNRVLRYNPTIWNYNLNDTTKWSTRLSLIPFNQLKTHIGLGEYNNIGTSLLWSPTNTLSINTSAFISKQFGYVFSSRQTLYGTNAMLSYVLTDKLLFRIWGQYVTPGSNDPFLNVNNLLPKTSVGADLQYKVNRKIDLGVGVEYQYDKKESTWKSESGGKVKIGF